MDKIVCFGKNYPLHAAEMKEEFPPKPVIFIKPPSTLQIWQKNKLNRLTLPLAHGEIHHELEVVIEIADDVNVIQGFGLGLDLTKRSLQNTLKKAAHPWSISKIFPQSSIYFPLFRGNLQKLESLKNTSFSLIVNGDLRQTGTIREMHFSPLQLIKHVSEYFPLLPGDLLFTGTPAGVGALKAGDTGFLIWDNMEEMKANFICEGINL